MSDGMVMAGRERFEAWARERYAREVASDPRAILMMWAAYQAGWAESLKHLRIEVTGGGPYIENRPD